LVVVKSGDMCVVGVFDDWYMVPAYAVGRLLAKLLDVDEEDVSLGYGVAVLSAGAGGGEGV
jgi:hypothetical protein